MSFMFDRATLTKLLLDYNAPLAVDENSWESTKAQINSLIQRDKLCVITGQQLGFMGGPAYTILKIITCLQVSKELNAVPIFWAATEDHDIEEINHTYNLDSLGNLKKWQLHLPRKGLSVEDLSLSESNQCIIKEYLTLYRFPEKYQSILNQPRQMLYENPELSYCYVMLKFLSQLFSGTGLVFVEPKILRPLAIKFFCKEIENAETIYHAYKNTTNRLIEKGEETPLDLKEGTFLFRKEIKTGARQKIKYSSGNYLIGKHFYSKNEILKEINSSPERFSCNVASRTVLQSLIIPTQAYVAGPHELKYYKQLEEYHHFHGIELPQLIARISATIISPWAEEYLNKCNLKNIDETNWNELQWENISDPIAQEMVIMATEWFQLIPNYYKRHHQRNIKKKIYKMLLKEQELTYNALHKLKNLIKPCGKLQERVLNWNAFYNEAQLDPNKFIQKINQVLDWKKAKHQYIYTKDWTSSSVASANQ